jgi:hypothetical protein
MTTLLKSIDCLVLDCGDSFDLDTLKDSGVPIVVSVQKEKVKSYPSIYVLKVREDKEGHTYIITSNQSSSYASMIVSFSKGIVTEYPATLSNGNIEMAKDSIVNLPADNLFAGIGIPGISTNTPSKPNSQEDPSDSADGEQSMTSYVDPESGNTINLIDRA